MSNIATHVRPQVSRKPNTPNKNVSNRPANVAHRPAVAKAQVSLAKSAESGAEERTFGVQHKKSEFEDKLDKKGTELRKKKIKEIQKVESLLFHHQDPKELASLLSSHSDSRVGLNEVYAGSQEKGDSPIMLLAALEATEKSQTLSQDQKANLADFKDRVIDEHGTEILLWKHSVDGVREKIKSPELADAVLQLIGKSNTQQPGYWQTFVDILDVAGKDNFSSVTMAYVGALNDDTKKSVASTNHAYLSDMLDKVSKFSKAKSMVSQGDTAAATLIKKFSDLEKNGMDFLKASMIISTDPDKKQTGDIATGYMGLGEDRKRAFVSQVHGFLKSLPHGLWDGESEKLKVFSVLSDYSSGSAIQGVSSKEESARRKLEALMI